MHCFTFRDCTLVKVERRVKVSSKHKGKTYKNRDGIRESEEISATTQPLRFGYKNLSCEFGERNLSHEARRTVSVWVIGRPEGPGNLEGKRENKGAGGKQAVETMGAADRMGKVGHNYPSGML